MGALGAVRPPGGPYGAAWAASRADRRRSTIINGRPRVAASLAFVGAGRSVPARARHLAAGPPEIKKKGNCAPVCADPVDL
jgi:hypothetical protein